MRSESITSEFVIPKYGPEVACAVHTLTTGNGDACGLLLDTFGVRVIMMGLLSYSLRESPAPLVVLVVNCKIGREDTIHRQGKLS